MFVVKYSFIITIYGPFADKNRFDKRPMLGCKLGGIYNMRLYATKNRFSPGINKQVTATGAEGQWIDCDNVRFRYGTPEKIGGWNN